ncbi:MAG: Gfo/Idh/MocA family protein [Gemmataceae bacterium]
MLHSRSTRRQFVKTAALASTGFWLGSSSASRAEQSPNEKLNVAVIGLGGQGNANLGGVGSQNIVALCDVDDKRAGSAYEKHPKATKFYDYRQLFDKMEKQLDAVVVSTPDHSHFHPAFMAVRAGKHVYLEKPMCHDLWQVRKLCDLAREKKVATQLGVQRHAGSGMHRIIEVLQSGAIGDVKEVHSWIGGSRGMPKVPDEKPPVPETLKWDLWVGPSVERPYHPTYAPYGWRFWWDYGTGETGNWGCHILDIPFWALGLKHPTKVEASGPPVSDLTTPKSMHCRFEFPKEEKHGPLTLHWYHGTPPILAEKGLKGGNNLFIGTKGMLLCDFGKYTLYPEKDFADFKPPKETVPNSPGFHREWISACKGGEPATCNFEYTGPLTETVLLGNVAYRAGSGFDWDHKTLTAKGNDKAANFIRVPFRKGWELG